MIGGAAYRNRTDDLRITSVSECEMVVDGQSGPVLEPASESTASEG